MMRGGGKMVRALAEAAAFILLFLFFALVLVAL